jgi:hypothetical protein
VERLSDLLFLTGFVSAAHQLFLQQLLYLFERLFPTFLLFAAESFKGIDHGSGNILRLQISREFGNVIIQPLKVMVVNGAYALQHFTSIEGRLGVCERIGGSVGTLSVDEGESIGAHAEPLEVRSGQLQVDLIPIAAYMVDLKNGLAARHCYLITYQWHGRRLRGSGLGGRFLAGLSHDSASLAECDGFHGS